MTTGSGKKTSKTGKAPASRGRRKKIVEKAPAPAAIDKEKMAAFFSAAGLEKTSEKPEKDLVKDPVKVDEAKEVVSEVVSEKSVVEPPIEPTIQASESASVDDSPPPVAKEPEKIEPVVVVAPAVMTVTESESSDSEKGEAVMTTSSPATSGGSGSGSFGVLPMLFILAALAVGWFFYISPGSLKTAAIAPVEQGAVEPGETAIAALMSKVKVLEAEVAKLGLKLKSAIKAKTPVKKEVVAVKKAAPKSKPMSATVVKQDSSFDKAPIPFWRQMKRGGSLIQKNSKEVKSDAKSPAAKVDSFSKAPKPFWLTPRVKPVVAKVKKELKISASPATKVASKLKKIGAKQEPVSAPALDPSFEKAPKPFWLKD